MQDESTILKDRRRDIPGTPKRRCASFEVLSLLLAPMGLTLSLIGEKRSLIVPVPVFRSKSKIKRAAIDKTEIEL